MITLTTLTDVVVVSLHPRIILRGPRGDPLLAEPRLPHRGQLHGGARAMIITDTNNNDDTTIKYYYYCYYYY